MPLCVRVSVCPNGEQASIQVRMGGFTVAIAPNFRGGYGAYCRRLVRWARRSCSWGLEIVARPAEAGGYVLLKGRWIVERTFGWLNLSGRLSKDYEVLPASGEAFIRLALFSIMLRRLAHEA
jgi:transposase